MIIFLATRAGGRRMAAAFDRSQQLGDAVKGLPCSASWVIFEGNVIMLALTAATGYRIGASRRSEWRAPKFGFRTVPIFDSRQRQ